MCHSNHSAKHNQRVESSIRKIWDPRHPRYRHRASVRLIRVLRLPPHIGVQARDIVSDLCSVEWKGGKLRENSEASVQEVQRLWPLRVSGTTRLAKHSHRRHWNEPSAKADGKGVQNTTTNSRQTVIAKLRHRRRGPRTTGSKAAPEVSLLSTHKTS